MRPSQGSPGTDRHARVRIDLMGRETYLHWLATRFQLLSMAGDVLCEASIGGRPASSSDAIEPGCRLQQRRRPPAGLGALQAAQPADNVVHAGGRRMVERREVDWFGLLQREHFDLERG